MNLEKTYKLIEKYHWIWFVFLIIAPNFLEPTWFWRWIAIMVLAVIFTTIFIWTYYAWLVLRRDPLSITSQSQEQYATLNSSQRKWHLGLFYFGVFIAAPIILYVLSFPTLDTINAVINRNYVESASVTVLDSTTVMGTWFIGQSLKIEEQEISDGGLLIMFSLEHAQEGQKYEVKYLPYSGLVLEMNKVLQ